MKIKRISFYIFSFLCACIVPVFSWIIDIVFVKQYIFNFNAIFKVHKENPTHLIIDIVSIAVYVIAYRYLKFRKETIKNISDLHRINDISRQINSNLKLNFIFTKINEYLFKTHGFESAFLVLVTDDKKNYKITLGKFPENLNRIEKDIIGTTMPLVLKSNDKIAHCIMKRKIFFYPEIKVEKIKNGSNKKAIAKLKVKSTLTIPINVGDEVIGAFILSTHLKSIYLTDEEVNSISQFVSQMAVAIQNSQLFSKLKLKNFEIERLNEISKDISSTLELDVVFSKIVNYLKDRYGFEGYVLFLVDQRRCNVIFEKFSVPKEIEKMFYKYKGLKFPLDVDIGWVPECISENKVIYIDNINIDTLKNELNRQTVEVQKIKTILLIPILEAGEVIGAFSIANYSKPIYIIEENIETIKRFVNQIALTLKNSKLFEKVKIKGIKLQKAYSEINSINEIAKQISETLDFDSVFRKIVDYLNYEYGFEGGSLALINADRKTYKLEKIFLPDELSEIEKSHTGYVIPLTEEGGFIGLCMLKNQHYYLTDINPSQIANEITRITILIYKIKTLLNMPISIGNEVIGAFSLTSHSKALHLSEDDIEAIARFVNQIAIVIKNSKLYNEIEATKIKLEEKDFILSEDLKIAKNIQRSIVSSDYKEIKKLDIDVFFRPMMEVGGDIYDIYEMKEGYYRIFIIDATGHGVQAALITMILKAEYDQIKFFELEPDEILKIFNAAIINNYPNLSVFFTGFLLDIDTNKEKITYCSGGHSSQLLFSENTMHDLYTYGRMIGITPDVDYKKGSFDLKIGDKLFLFTDGMFEQFSEEDIILGEKQFREILTKNISQPIPEIIKNVVERVVNWVGINSIRDDMTIIGIERKS